MTRWTVKLSKAAEREFRRLDEPIKRDAADLMEDLSLDPKMVPAVEMGELEHYPGVWKARFHHDSHRMVYRISKAEKIVWVMRIRPRPTAYAGFKRPNR